MWSGEGLRDHLRLLAEETPTPALDSTVIVARARARRRRFAAGAGLVAASLTALVAVPVLHDLRSDRAVVDQSAAPAADTGHPSALVGQWTVHGPDVPAGTIVSIDGRGFFDLFEPCGILDGAWAARPGGAIVFWSGGSMSGSCPSTTTPQDLTPEWLAPARTFRTTAATVELLSPDDQLLATLTAGHRPDLPDDVTPDFADPPPPLSAEAQTKLDRTPAALPANLTPATPATLAGPWALPGRPAGRSSDWPRVTFNRDATWTGSDGCNDLGGRWTLQGPLLVAVHGNMTTMGCENVNLLAGVAGAGFDGPTLVLLDTEGHPLHRLYRDQPAPAKPTESSTRRGRVPARAAAEPAR